MKIAENSVKSVVTVENDLSNDTTVSDNKNDDNEIGSGVVYKKWATLYILLMHTLSVIKKNKSNIW